MKMVRFLAVLMLAMGLGPPAVFAQVVGTITGTGCSQPNGISIDVTGKGVVGISVTNSGTAWSGTIQPEVAIGGDAAQNITVTPYNSTTAQPTITANGVYQAYVSGATTFYLCGNTVTNTAGVKLQVVNLSARGGGGATGAGQGAVFASNFGVQANTQYRIDATSSNTSQQVTCPDCNFTATDQGKIVWGLQPQVSAAYTLAVPQGTITSVTNGTTIQVSNAATATVSGTLYLVWGSDDTTGLINAFAATYALANQKHCLTLILPVGLMILQQSWATTVPGTNCNLGYNNPSIFGYGKGNTLIVIPPNFNYATCSTSCIGGYLFDIFQGWSVYGFFYHSGTCPASTPLMFNNSGFLIDMDVQGWCTGGTNPGTEIGGNGASAYFGGNEDSGSGTLLASTGGQLINFVTGGPQSTQTLEVSGKGNVSLGNFNQVMVVDATGSLRSEGDTIAGASNVFNGSASLDTDSFTNTSGGWTQGPGAIVSVKNTKFGTTGGVTLYNTAILQDDGGNTVPASANAFNAQPALVSIPNSGAVACANCSSIALSGMPGTVGHSYFVMFDWVTGVTNSGCSDGTNTYTTIGAQQTTGTTFGSARLGQLYKIVNNQKSGTFTITCTLSGSSTRADLMAIEINEADQTTLTDPGFTITPTAIDGTTFTSGAQTTQTPSDLFGYEIYCNQAGLSSITNTGNALFSTVGQDSTFRYNQTFGAKGTSYTLAGTIGASSDCIIYYMQILPRTPSGVPQFKNSFSTQNGTQLVASNVVPTAGTGAGQWGTAPSVTVQNPSVSTRMVFTVTAGTTPGANPVTTITFPVAFKTLQPICHATQIGGTQALALISTPQSTTTQTQVVATWTGTPTGGNTVQMEVDCQ